MSGFIPIDQIVNIRPDLEDMNSPFVAWTPGSTPPELISRALEVGVIRPEMPTLDDIFQYDRIAAEIYLTRTCALNCEGCSVPVGVRWAKEERQPVQDWMRAINALHERGLEAVKFIGGEVGTLPWLAEVAGFAVDEGMRVSIFTDGVPFLQDPEKFRAVMKETEGKVLWMTSVDFVPPTEEMARAAGKNEDLARRFKAQRGINFIKMVREAGGVVIGHMMLHEPNMNEILAVYQAVRKNGGIFSVGTMQKACHLYQGRHPDAYRHALAPLHAGVIAEQMMRLVALEDENIKRGVRTLANSRAHLHTTATAGIHQNIGCSDNAIGPPGVFALMPDGTLRGCPVIMTEQQIRGCPGCAYAVFRDGDPRWSNYLSREGFYKCPPDKDDFPSLFYPTPENNFQKGILPWQSNN